MSAVHGRGLDEPRISSSVYCAGHLDELLHSCIAPLWLELRAGGFDGHLWLMRYARCGEHLKLRFHGSHAEAEAFRRVLRDAVEDFFTRLSSPPVVDQPLNDQLFPVDPEDLAEEPYPDRTVLWTTYRWNPGTMGREPLAEDRTLASLFTHCLAAGCEHVLREFAPDQNGVYRASMRIRLVRELLVCAPACLGFPPHEAVRYLDYHRDWLILGAGGDLAETHELFGAKMRREVGDPSAFWSSYRRAAADGPRDALDTWIAALGVLLAHVCRLAGVGRPWEPEDLYARDQVLAPLFKSLHGLANLVRVGLYNEAYLCHVIARSMAERGESSER